MSERRTVSWKAERQGDLEYDNYREMVPVPNGGTRSEHLSRVHISACNYISTLLQIRLK